MGSDVMHCRDTEIGDEMLDNMIKEIPLKDVPLKESFESYKSSLNWGNNDYGKKTVYLDYSKFSEFLNPLIVKSSNKYQNEQIMYFDDVRNLENGTEILGQLIILLSNGNKEEQIDYSCELYNTFHDTLEESSLHNTILGIVRSFSDVALESFASLLPNKEYIKLKQIYVPNKQRALADYIMSNYRFIAEKKNKGKTPVGEDSKKSNKKEKDEDKALLKRFFELIYSHLNGSYIKNWLNDEYLKEKPKLINPCDFCAN